MKFMFDTNVYDKIVATNGLTQKLRELISKNLINIYKTHIQVDEINEIIDTEKRNALLNVPGELIATSGSAWDTSKFDLSKWGDGTDDLKFNEIQKGNKKHTKDALIAITAASDVDIFVTEEVKTLPNRIKAANSKLTVWDFNDFINHINQWNP